VPSSLIVSNSGSDVTYRDAAGVEHRIHGARLVARDHSQEIVVKPGSPVPASLRGRTPDEVIR
jgi:hypothetical protein